MDGTCIFGNLRFWENVWAPFFRFPQTNGFENGIYVLTTVGDGSTAWVLTRATDSDDASKLAAAFSFVTSGTTFENIGFSMNTETS